MESCSSRSTRVPYRIAVRSARAKVDSTGQNVSALADAVASAEAHVAEAEAQLRLAEAQYNRIQPLIEIGAVPYQDKDKADAGLAYARSALVDAQARRTQALHQLGDRAQRIRRCAPPWQRSRTPSSSLPGPGCSHP